MGWFARAAAISMRGAIGGHGNVCIPGMLKCSRTPDTVGAFAGIRGHRGLLMAIRRVSST
jgi:hypothetical protein